VTATVAALGLVAVVTFGVWCEVVRPGTMGRGDPVGL
jgi:hypothetical protein